MEKINSCFLLVCLVSVVEKQKFILETNQCPESLQMGDVLVHLVLILTQPQIDQVWRGITEREG